MNLSARPHGSIVRIDAATGDRSVVSDGTTGRGRHLQGPWGVDVGPKGKIAVVDSLGEPRFCIATCPNPLCLICLFPAAALVKVDPETGRRRRVSGGGTCVYTLAGCQSPFFGQLGDGPAMLYAADIAREASDSYVVSYFGDPAGQGVMRVDPATRQRTILFEGLSPADRRALGERLHDALWTTMQGLRPDDLSLHSPK